MFLWGHADIERVSYPILCSCWFMWLYVLGPLRENKTARALDLLCLSIPPLSGHKMIENVFFFPRGQHNASMDGVFPLSRLTQLLSRLKCLPANYFQCRYPCCFWEDGNYCTATSVKNAEYYWHKPFSKHTFRLRGRKGHLFPIPLMMSLFCSRVPVSCDTEPAGTVLE